jgi:hypothetical protein
MNRVFVVAAVALGVAMSPASAMSVGPISHGSPLLGAQLVAGGCGAGYRRTASGRCAPDVYPHTAYHCQPGTHPVPHPNASGYRCVVDR